ncbi:MAG: hypothetical protein NZL89_05190 [Leptospiraceae bacterium]|nr:hypothetical protein [Leptospiraceae bacterium]
MRTIYNFYYAILLLANGCIALGEQDTDAACVSALRARQVRFTRDVAPLLEKHCIRCHNNMGTHEAFRTNYYPNKATVRINLPMSDPRYMPPGVKLTACEILTFEKWEADGFAP